MLTAYHILLVAVGLWLISGTLLNFSKHPHWYIRGWDFPRVFAAVLATAVGFGYAIAFHRRWWDWLLLAGLAFVVLRQLYMIFPYTPIARKRVKRSARPPEGESFRLLMSNVLQESEQHEKWLKVVREADPDVIVAVEIDAKWDAALFRALEKDYPHAVRHAQDNYYGMVLYSRLEFVEKPEVRFIVQDDIPSIHVTLRLRDGQQVCLHAMHPRPPEPLRDQDSAPRDAELVLLGREIAEHERTDPTIVCGDLNDVAWSYTTQLFLRLSKLLDPRMGRGLYNSYNANSRVFRFPLDHVFHSDEFKLVDLRVLGHVGSDHFPMLIELSCQPEAARQAQPEPRERAEDQKEADEIVHEQAEREVDGEEHGHANKRVGEGVGQGTGRA
jgi:endonuclease/exonuclease/phosphatase (EEP) superfamily protein YafD